MASSLSVGCFFILCCFMQQVVESATGFTKGKQREIGFLCSRGCKEVDDQQSDTGFPLYRCSCSPSCSIYEDCCFDSPYKDITLRRNGKFACLSVVDRDGYLAVSDCPSDNPSDFCKYGLEYSPPVTSRVTNVTYANKFCAECNDDDEDLITWNVKVRCPVDVNSGGKRMYIYQSGNIWIVNKATRSKAVCKYLFQYDSSKLIERLELRSCSRQDSKKISHCSSSWKEASVAEMCRSYEDPVYFQDTEFRNAHCAICNYQDRQFENCYPSRWKSQAEKLKAYLRMQKNCKGLGYAACIQFLLMSVTRGNEYGLGEIFYINETGCVPPKGKICCSGESFDKRSQRCRKKIH